MRRNILKFDLSTADAYRRKNIQPNDRQSHLQSFWFKTEALKTDVIVLYKTKKPYTLYDGDRANVAIRKPLPGDQPKLITIIE